MNERSRKDVQTEIEVLSLLSHINICGYFNHFIHEHMLYIELEYANGEQLNKHILRLIAILFIMQVEVYTI